MLHVALLPSLHHFCFLGTSISNQTGPLPHKAFSFCFILHSSSWTLEAQAWSVIPAAFPAAALAFRRRETADQRKGLIFLVVLHVFLPSSTSQHLFLSSSSLFSLTNHQGGVFWRRWSYFRRTTAAGGKVDLCSIIFMCFLLVSTSFFLFPFLSFAQARQLLKRRCFSGVQGRLPAAAASFFSSLSSVSLPILIFGLSSFF